MSMSPNGRTMISTGKDDRKVVIWDEGSAMSSERGHVQGVSSLDSIGEACTVGDDFPYHFAASVNLQHTASCVAYYTGDSSGRMD